VCFTTQPRIKGKSKKKSKHSSREQRLRSKKNAKGCAQEKTNRKGDLAAKNEGKE